MSAMLLLFGVNSSGQTIGKATVPEEALKATILIEKRVVIPKTNFVHVENLVDAIQLQGTNLAHVPATGFHVRQSIQETNYVPLGSGVLLSWTNRFFVATASHVIPSNEDVFFAIPQRGCGSVRHASHLETRFSSKLGWVRSTNADLALTTIYFNVDADDVKTVPLETFSATYEKVSVGDDVFVAGFPASIVDISDPTLRVIRNGVIAGKVGNGMLLLDAFTYPGNSGGPVFWKPTMGFDMMGVKVPGQPVCLVGLVLYSHQYREEGVSRATGRTLITLESNSGLSDIVSTSRILELLEYPEVKEALARWSKM